MMDVSIIIVNYNTADLLKNTITTVFEHTIGVDYEIIVVDNASSDNSKQIVADTFGNNVKYLSLSENIGFGCANNRAIEIAQGRNIFLLNPDTLLLNNAVKILSDHLDANPTVGVCGGNLYDANLQPTHSFMRLMPGLLFELDLLLLSIPSRIIWGINAGFNHTQRPLNVAYITGADMMIRKNVLDEVGLFDPAFFMYYEETELSLRIKKAGYKIQSVPQARIIHLEGQSFSIKESRERIMLNSRTLFLKKIYSPTLICLINLLHTIALISLSIYLKLRNKSQLLLIIKQKREYFKKYGR